MGEIRFAKCRFPLLRPNSVTLFVTSGSKSAPFFRGAALLLLTPHWGHNSWHSLGYPIFLLSFNLSITGDTSWDIHAFLLLLLRLTNCDTAWDIPSFSLPSIYQALGALLGTSFLFYHTSIVTQTMTSVGIPQHFRPQPKETFFITSYHFAKRTIGTLLATRL